jgi:hypothetical protein
MLPAWTHRTFPLKHERVKETIGSGAVVCPRIMSMDLDDLTCKIWFSSLAYGA